MSARVADDSAFPAWLQRVGHRTAWSAVVELLRSSGLLVRDAAGDVLFWHAASGIWHSKLGEELPRELFDSAGSANTEGVSLALKGQDDVPVHISKSSRFVVGSTGEILGQFELYRLGCPAQDDPSPSQVAIETRFHGLLTRESVMQHVFDVIRNVAETDVTVLIRGESGTGKELVAKAIHAESRRRDQPFVAVNCAALTQGLLESALFGHVKGAFTGAVRDHPGFFREADGGTLFLDEVAELSLELQAKLLRALQERSVTPVGASRSVKVNVRIVAATHRSLREAVKAGQFREDLLYRLRVVPLFLPPLRTRCSDIPLLFWEFIKAANVTGPRRIDDVAPEVWQILQSYRWPGNVRELQNIVAYGCAVGRGSVFTCNDLPPDFRDRNAERNPVSIPATNPVTGEAERMRTAIIESAGSLDEAARKLGMSRATFWRKRKRYGIT